MKAVTWLYGLYRREPAATQAAAAAVYVLADALYRTQVQHTGAMNWSLAGAAIAAVYALMVRAQVVPTVKLPPPPVPPEKTLFTPPAGSL